MLEFDLDLLLLLPLDPNQIQATFETIAVDVEGIRTLE